MCDHTAHLGVADTFALFMDIATDDAERLGMGAEAMAGRGLFWLTTKTKVCFHRRPAMMADVTVSTCPQNPERIRWIREYGLEQDGEILARGKTEWVVLETDSGRMHPIADIVPEGWEPPPAPEVPEPFAKVRMDAKAGEELGRWRVRSTDIDLGGHMNNVAYVRALMAQFTTAQWEDFPVREMDVIFRAPCYEGDELIFRMRRSGEDAVEVGAFLPDGTGVLLARLVK
jgi:acyl-CoA thioesterase FadM